MDFSLLLMPLSLLLGWWLDFRLGDPSSWPHPVVYMGRWISFWEHRLNKGACRMAKGACLAVASALLVFLLFAAVVVALRLLEGSEGGWLATVGLLLFQSVAVFFCLAGKTLRDEVRMVFEALDRSLDEGRRQVARIVGRDTQRLSAQEVRTAALETLAENLSDGVVAPLFWFALLGVPGMMMYKMVNTLDSMIGYHSPRYLKFGCWAARMDDVANFIPARLTALLMLLVGAGFAKGVSFRQLLAFVRRYGPQHASPNSGWPEAALAAILNCRFGGPHDYFGELFQKPYIGENERLLCRGDMAVGLAVAFRAELLAVGLLLFSFFFIG